MYKRGKNVLRVKYGSSKMWSHARVTGRRTGEALRLLLSSQLEAVRTRVGDTGTFACRAFEARRGEV